MTLRNFGVAGALILLLIMVAEVVCSTRQESPSWDEGDHIYSGYMNWQHDEYSLNPEHPPLVKLVATLPLLPLHLKIAPRQGRFFKDEAYYGGRELLFRNGPEYGGQYTADTLLFRIHMFALSFGLMLGLLLFLAGREMFGTVAGLIALTLFVFDPTVITNAPFVTTDMGAACGFFAGVYTFYRFVKMMLWRRALLCGVVVGLAMGAKHSAVMLLPMLILLAAGETLTRWKMEKAWPARFFKRMALGLGIVGAVSYCVLWGLYSFRYSMHPNGVEMPPLTRQVSSLPNLSQSAILFLSRYHLLPESYIYGLVDVQRVGRHLPTYIFGKVYAHGQWFYFPALLSLKWSIGVLGLLALTVYALSTNRLPRSREVAYMVLPAGLYMAIAMAGPLNIGIRHLLPVFPFVFALIGGGAWALIQRRTAWIYPIALLLGWHVFDSIRMFPNYMPYANALWGGSQKTHLYFSDSAVEWGQELKWTKQWLDARKVKECWFAYFPAPFLLPSDYGIACKLLPTDDTLGEEQITVPPVIHGPILISFPDLNGFEFGTKVRNPYQSLFEREPDEMIADGIAVYEGDVSLPLASALRYELEARLKLKENPEAALEAAREAITIAPKGFDANLALGNVLAATGKPEEARSAYRVALSRVADMEPSAQEHWRSVVNDKLQSLTVSNGASGTVKPLQNASIRP